MKSKKAKILICVGLAVIIIASALLGLFFNPKIHYVVSKPVEENAENYVEFVTIAYQTHLGLPLPGKTKALLSDFSDRASAIRNDISQNYSAPKNIVLTVKYENGSSIFCFDGTATQNGASVEYHRSFYVDGTIKGIEG